MLTLAQWHVVAALAPAWSGTGRELLLAAYGITTTSGGTCLRTSALSHLPALTTALELTVTHIAVTTASDIDGGLDLLALPEAVNPQEWEVVIVHSDGSRTAPAASGTGAGGIAYPRFGSSQPEFKHWWYADGFTDCHAEIHAPATGDRVQVALRPTDGRCPGCQAGELGA